MVAWVVGLLVLACVIAFIYRRLQQSNMAMGPNVERALSEREALRFRLDNGLPIK